MQTYQGKFTREQILTLGRILDQHPTLVRAINGSAGTAHTDVAVLQQALNAFEPVTPEEPQSEAQSNG